MCAHRHVVNTHVIGRIHVLVFTHIPIHPEIGHAKLLTLIDEQRPRKGTHHEGKELPTGDAVLGRVRGEARDGAGLVVVLQENGGPSICATDQVLGAPDGGFEVGEFVILGRGLELVGALSDVDDVLWGGLPSAIVHVLPTKKDLGVTEQNAYELEDHVELFLLRRHVSDYPRHVGRKGTLAHRHGVVFLQHLVQLPQKLVHPRPVTVLQPGKLPLTAWVRHGRICHVAFTVHVHGIDSETVHPLLEPELRGDLKNGSTRLGVLPVEIGLLGTEQMEIVLFGLRIPLPGAAAKVAEPVVGGLTFPVDITGWTPNIPVALGVVL